MQRSTSYEIPNMNEKIDKYIIEYTQVQIHIHSKNWSNLTFSNKMEPSSQHVHNASHAQKRENRS